MSVKPKPKAPSRAITRFRITRANPPADHRHPTTSYFQRVADPPRLLPSPQPLPAPSAHPQRPSLQQSPKQLPDQSMLTLSSLMLTTAGTHLQITGLAPSALEDPNSPPKTEVKLEPVGPDCKQQAAGRMGENSKHISYQEYEQMLDEQNLNPTYFQKLAKRNDQKHEATLQANQTTSDTCSDKPTPEKERSRVRIVRPKTEISMESSQKTIISCHIGALSTHAIKEKLESKWEEEGRANRMNLNNYTFTEESDFASDADTHRPTTREELHSIRQKQKPHKPQKPQKHPRGKMLTQPEQTAHRPVEWEKINNEKFKATLKHILEIRRESGFRKREVDFSCGQEYEQQEESLTALQEVYRPRLLQLKHKLEWKI